MSYVAQAPLDRTLGLSQKNVFTGDGSTVNFDMTTAAPSDTSVDVFVDNVRQEPGTGKAYILASNGTDFRRITFSTAPANGATIWTNNRLRTQTTNTVPDNSVTNSSLNSSALSGQTALGTTPAAADVLLLYDDSASALKKVTYANFGGDIAGVTAGTGLSGGGTSGTVTVAIDTSVTVDVSTAQTLTNKVLTSPVITTPQINDTSADHQYVFAVSELAADRTVTLPLLAAADEFTFNAHAQTLTNKTLTSPDINTPDIDGGNIDGTIIGASTAAAATVSTFTSTGIDDNANALAMTIIADGNVGIGTAAPESDSILELESGSPGPRLRLTNTSGSGDSWKIHSSNDGTLSFLDDTDSTVLSFTTGGTINALDSVLQRPTIKDYGESYTATSGTGTVDLDMTDGNVFQHTASGGNVTFTFSNPSANGISCAFTLKWIQDSSDRTATWPASVDWAAATAPTLTSGSGKVDVFTFFTVDAGTTWYGFTAGQDMS